MSRFLVLMVISAIIIETFSLPLNNVSSNSSNSSTSNFAEAKEAPVKCQFDDDCGHGECVISFSRQFPNGTSACQCSSSYASRNGVCNYERRDKVTAFIVSLLFGYLGVDWFYLARGSPKYNGLGVLKLFTLGGIGVWYIIDIIRIGIDDFDDGDGVGLKDW